MTTAPAPALLPAGHPVRRAVREHLHLHPADRLLVAVSGGADSLALAAAVLREVGPAVDAPPVAAVIDHGLQDGSAGQAAATAELLRRWGYADTRVRRVRVGSTGGTEAAARAARYAALRELAAGPAGRRVRVLLGHTMDDQAETVLLGLSRGSGPRSIAGMRTLTEDALAPAPRPGPEPSVLSWGRPLLGVRRADTENACATMGIDWWNDPHNRDARFTRVRLRREVLPLLDDVLGGGATPALARTADLLADDLAALDGWAAAALTAARRAAPVRNGDQAGQATSEPLATSELTALPDAVARRVLRRWLLDAGVSELTADHLHRLLLLIRQPARTPPASVRLPGGVDATRVGEVMLLIERSG